MATVLLIIIYIAFIGLGIPDSLFGTAWPAIYMEFNFTNPMIEFNSANFYNNSGYSFYWRCSSWLIRNI